VDKLVEYFIKETDKKFIEVREELKRVNQSLIDLQKFKVKMLTSSAFLALLISVAVRVLL